MSDIKVYVTSNLASSERRISPQWDFSYFKKKLEVITGIEPKYQNILYYASPSSKEYQVIADASKYSEENDEQAHLSDIGIVPYSRLHIVDTNDNSTVHQVQDLDGVCNEDVEFKYSNEDYARKQDSVLRWKADNKLGRFDPDFEQKKLSIIQENMRLSSTMQVGQRCRIINIQGERRGTIRFIGKIPLLDEGAEVWVGVEFDEPVGKNSGYIDGVKIFDCRKNHGSFVKPKLIEVGDFPEDDPFISDDEI